MTNRMAGIINSSPGTLSETTFQFPGQTAFYRGKVRDVYTIADKFLAMVVTDRISAFDVVLPRAIPFKGQVLNQVAAYMLKATSDILANWIVSIPDPNVTIGRMCKPFPVEMVIRGYLSGHAWREYRQGKRMICGVRMPEGMKENERFPEPIITPTTKAAYGHDLDISRDEIIRQGIVDSKIYEQLEAYTRALFTRGNKLASERGLILGDTKYEFGMSAEIIYVIDEIHTPDSSRYFYLDGFDERQSRGEAQKQLSKEFVRQWLIEHNFQGKEGQIVPEMKDEWVNRISERYIELYEKLIGEKFIRQNIVDIENRVENSIRKSLGELGFPS